MTCHQGILAARRHAELCNAAEETAPVVTASYLEAAYRRMKLPIAVSIIGPDTDPRFNIRATDLESFEPDDIVREVTRSPVSATVAYFDLVSHFQSALPRADAPTLGAAAESNPPGSAAPISDPAPSLPAETHSSGAATSPDARSDAASGVLSSQARA